MKKITILLSVFLGTTFFVYSQGDAEGCKDHAFFNRLPNYVITSCSENFNSTEFLVGQDKNETLEGNMYKARYDFNREAGTKPPSKLQVLRNYEAAIKKNGGKTVYFDKEENGTFNFKKDGKEYWVAVRGFYTGSSAEELDGFDLVILEKELMKQDIEASAMFDEINKSGHIALYINFETGKATIKPESSGIIDQIVAMLKGTPDLKVAIEGHTDNTGTPAGNKTLSENRAKAVVAALVAKGIAANRLTAKGMGQDKPVADNATDEGKAKNRRVEIVKM